MDDIGAHFLRILVDWATSHAVAVVLTMTTLILMMEYKYSL
jgi:hypothetical protein